MVTFQRTKYYLIVFFTLLLASCTTSDSDPNNSVPGLFSANTIETTANGATIEWTESIDPDDDDVSYAIILEGQEIASGGTNLTYSFSGLEPETNYEGYVEARDGNGGTSLASFFFTTEPEVIIQTLNIKYRWWEGAGGYGIVAYFEVPAIDNALSYHLEILDYTPDVIPSNVGRTYFWKPDDSIRQGNDVGSGASHLTEFSPGLYHANTTTGSGPMSNFPNVKSYYESIVATARLTVIVGQE
ncbi:hypothetical protein DIS18_13510 [Algibacter marinivivus]|uniref:Fibronectin type-III domain-containing protein n=1 Tax=Algibacter marinivivus TaxID=2100723 RepID=A0A2U2X1R3_9FLAO|nr:fibronectin type III domain-containing protein [Algibacter marinivivus]PWH81694.1 hypothetical protein DIS18_13510 [Algibacter marinivivus]